MNKRDSREVVLRSVLRIINAGERGDEVAAIKAADALVDEIALIADYHVSRRLHADELQIHNAPAESHRVMVNTASNL